MTTSNSTPDSTPAALRSPILLAFAVVAVVHVLLNALDLTPWNSITKCLLAPLLVAWVLQQRGPKLIAVALVCCFFGDLFLEIEDLFLLGMAAFAIGHVCFVTFFVQRGALDRLKRNPLIVAALVVAAGATIALVWTGLEPELRVPVLVYSLLLSTTGATALATDARAGLGAVLFLVSDAVIALGLADRIEEGGIISTIGIMPLYILAIFLLATATTFREQRSREVVAQGWDPTRRTDCWPTVPAKGADR